MPSSEIHAQPVQDYPKNEAMEDSSDNEANPSPTSGADPQANIPTHKSSVYVDPFAPSANFKFKKGDIVNMSIIEHGTRRKGVFTIYKARYSRSQGCCTYQLIDNGPLYDDGTWIRERDLRLERSAR